MSENIENTDGTEAENGTPENTIIMHVDPIYEGESRVTANKRKKVGGVDKVLTATVSLPNVKLRKDHPEMTFEELLQYYIDSYGAKTVVQLAEKSLVINVQDIIRTYMYQDRLDELATLRTSYTPLMSVSSRIPSVADSAKTVIDNLKALDGDTRKNLVRGVYKAMLESGELTQEQFNQFCAAIV